VAPNLTLPNRKPTQIRMPSEPRRISSIVWVISWALMIGPTVVVSRVQSTGPMLGLACMIATMLAILPLVGRTRWQTVLPSCSTPAMAIVGDGLGDAVAEALADGAALPLELGDGVGLGVGVALGAAEALARAEANAEAFGVGVAGTGVGCGKRPTCLVRMVK
jgi:hypothetical protein